MLQRVANPGGRMRYAALSLSLVLLSTPASAADWVYVGTATTRAAYYHDPSSVRRVGDHLAAWRKVDHSRDRTVSYRESKSLWYFDCARDVQALKSFINYGPSGSVMSSHTISDYSLEWTPPAPETVGWTFQRLICGN